MRKHVEWLFILSTLLILCILIFPGTCSARRIALVIGNADYKYAPLKNPANDSRDMAVVLEKCNFDVTLKLNADHRTMEEAIRQFGKNLNKGDAGLFYYAGHGIQIKNRNYLIPINSKIESQSDIKFEAVNAEFVLAKMHDADNRLNIVVLDACRNNPFVRSFRSTTAGLARMDAPAGTLIAYATAPGSVAKDGQGRNGIYTKNLIEHIRNNPAPIEQILKEVRIDVMSETSRKQVPWESSSLTGNFFFTRPHENTSSVKIQNSGKDTTQKSAYEKVFWESIKDSKDPEEFNAYLEQFPNGIFAKLAQIKVQKYTSKIKSDQAEKESTKTTGKPKPEKSETNKTIDVQQGQYVQYQNGIIYDKQNGLEWFPGPDEDTTIKEAIKWSSNLQLDGGNWRLPSKKELKSLYSQSSGPRNMPALFNTKGWFLWTKVHNLHTTYPFAEVVNLRYGSTSTYTRTLSNCSNLRAFAVRKKE